MAFVGGAGKNAEFPYTVNINNDSNKLLNLPNNVSKEQRQ